MKQEPAGTYDDLIDNVGRTCVSIARLLRHAEALTIERTARYYSSVRVQGFEGLLNHLTIVERRIAEDSYLVNFYFLITRAMGDFEASIEALLSGLPSVIWDKMRDVMEIEFLFRHFVYLPVEAQIWLTASDHRRQTEFSPSKLRGKLAKFLQIRPDDLPYTDDYRQHSKILNVNPLPIMSNVKGITNCQTAIDVERSLLEIFTHVNRLVLIIDDLVQRFHIADTLTDADIHRGQINQALDLL